MFLDSCFWNDFVLVAVLLGLGFWTNSVFDLYYGFRANCCRILVAYVRVAWFVGVFGSSFVVPIVVFSVLVFTVLAIESVLSAGF